MRSIVVVVLGVFNTKPPSLALEATGGVPYDILKPVLDRANPEQLFTLEDYNPYLIEDTGDMWKWHCSRKFRGQVPRELETWRDMFMVGSTFIGSSFSAARF